MLMTIKKFNGSNYSVARTDGEQNASTRTEIKMNCLGCYLEHINRTSMTGSRYGCTKVDNIIDMVPSDERGKPEETNIFTSLFGGAFDNVRNDIMRKPQTWLPVMRTNVQPSCTHMQMDGSRPCTRTLADVGTVPLSLRGAAPLGRRKLGGPNKKHPLWLCSSGRKRGKRTTHCPVH